MNAWLSGKVLMLGFFCFSFFLIEGAMLDWGAIFLNEVKRIPIEMAGMGYAAFSIAMAGTITVGGKITSRLSTQLVIVGGGIIGIMWYLLMIYLSSMTLSLIGSVILVMCVHNSAPEDFKH